MRSSMKLLKTLTLLGQFGFTFITPPVTMGILGWWLQSRFGVGTWVMLVCLLIGLMTSFAGAVRFFRRVLLQVERKEQEDEPKEKPVVFYRHD